MQTLYLDIFSGISGDMFLAAMVDLGVDFEGLQAELRKLPVGGYHLHISRGTKQGISGTKFDVHLEDNHPPSHATAHAHSHGASHHQHGHGHSHEHHHDHEHAPHHEHAHGRSFAEIGDLIRSSALSDWVKSKALAVFTRVAVAEGKIHGCPPAEVHFHEVGAVDSIVDIVGACIALEALGRPRVVAAPAVDGFGWVHCAHGRFPIPAPATLEILNARGITLSQCEEPHELITPTGAALLAEFAEEFGPIRQLKLQRIGFGLGTRENKTRPNVLRAILGTVEITEAEAHQGWQTDSIVVLETNVDDISPEVIGHVMERSFAAGALDVFYTPVHMKKNRPGTLVSVLCEPGLADAVTELLLRETGSFGVRRHSCERRKLAREFRNVSTPYGNVRVKLGLLRGTVLHATPEFDTCRELALKNNVAFKEVYEAAVRAAGALRGDS